MKILQWPHTTRVVTAEVQSFMCIAIRVLKSFYLPPTVSGGHAAGDKSDVGHHQTPTEAPVCLGRSGDPQHPLPSSLLLLLPLTPARPAETRVSIKRTPVSGGDVRSRGSGCQHAVHHSTPQLCGPWDCCGHVSPDDWTGKYVHTMHTQHHKHTDLPTMHNVHIHFMF